MGISACHLDHFFAILINQVSGNKDHPLTTPSVSLTPQNWPIVSSRNCYLRKTLRNGERVLQVRFRGNRQHAIPHKSGNLLHQIRCALQPTTKTNAYQTARRTRIAVRTARRPVLQNNGVDDSSGSGRSERNQCLLALVLLSREKCSLQPSRSNAMQAVYVSRCH